MDFYAIASIGVWPQVVTDQQYACYFSSWGLLETGYSGTIPDEVRSIMRKYFSMMQNYKQYPRKYTM